MDTRILDTIWGASYTKGYYPYLALIDRFDGNTFSEKAWRFYPDLARHFDHKVPGQDSFFSPLLFSGERKNDHAAAPGVLFADLDNVRDLKPQLDVYWPHIMWMTSNENAQAIWLLSAREDDLSAWSELNQRMTYFMGADKGGWHASKLLRIPGTLNWKYDPPQMSNVVVYEPKGIPYAAEALRAELPAVSKGSASTLPYPELKQRGEWKQHLASIWHMVPLQVKSDLLSPTIRDRSYSIVRAANKMLDAGIQPTDVFHALWWAEWNKWRTDRHAPDYLWQIITNR